MNNTLGCQCVESHECQCAALALQAAVDFGLTEVLPESTVVNIPVVFNCCGNLSQANDPNLTDAQLEEQVKQLNLDFQALNHDYTSDCPSNMLNVRSGDVRINFYIQDIRRRYVSALGSDWHSGPVWTHRALGVAESMKTAAYGLAALQNDTALNVWCGYYSYQGIPDLAYAESAGYAYYPSGEPASVHATRHVALQSVVVGSVNSPAPNSPIESMRDGRTLTHEVGHFLGLQHSWGPENPNTTVCGRDNVAVDLPLARGSWNWTGDGTVPPGVANRGCGDEPYNNHMNYTNYASAFTPGQKNWMRKAFLFESHSKIGSAIRPFVGTRTSAVRWGASAATTVFFGDSKVWPLYETPPAPFGLSAEVSSSAITLSWQAPPNPPGAPVTGYVTQYRVAGASSWTNGPSPAGVSTTVSVTGLTVGTTYEFRVAAVSQVAGQGDWSEILTTTFVVPLAGPTRVASWLEGTGISVIWDSWTPPAGVTRSGYRVEYKSIAETEWLFAGTSGINNIILPRALFTKNVTYTFRVAAITSIGLTSYTNTVSNVTYPYGSTDSGLAGPTRVAARMLGTAISVIWDSLTPPAGVTRSGYRVEYKSEAATEWLFGGTSQINNFQLPGTLFTRNVTYAFRVAAITSIGLTNYSNAYNTVTYPY